jgi:murein DD-endopeptidase MepM/ murein hydrolase activator NlpD
MKKMASLSMLLLGLISAACSPRESAPPGVPTAPRTEADPKAAGRRWATAFYTGDTQSLWDHMDGSMQKFVGDKARLDAFRAQVVALGEEKEVMSEEVTDRGQAKIYQRVVRFTKGGGKAFVLVIGLEGGRVTAFGLKPVDPDAPAATTKLDYKTQSPLRLPFDGTWLVAWGGRTKAENHHVVMRDQRFAYDFLVEQNGTSHHGDGKRNEDYYCHGLPILAPAAGRVMSTVDGVPENVPGEMDASRPAGNYVIIDHGHDEFSLLAHLVPGSLTVKPGDSIRAGQVVGQCGNSGHSSEPHLHYQLQNGPLFGDADGLPAQFRDYVADGETVLVGEPVRGQTIDQGKAKRAR